MKYELKMYRDESKTVELFAQDPETAIEVWKTQMQQEDGWEVDYVTELCDDGEGRTFDVHGHCECCRRILLHDNYRTDIEGVMFCKPCWDNLTTDASPSQCDEPPACS